jgi:predicted ATP-dependent serine protease
MVAENVNEIPEKPEDSTDDRKEKKTRTGPPGGGRARIEFCPVPASELGDSEEVDWLWRGYIAPGTITLIAGDAKAGKTTLICHLLKEMANGGNLAGEVRAAKVLVITEEPKKLWNGRRDEIGLGDHVHFAVQPFMSRPSKADWQSYIEQITAAVEEGQYDLVIIDTWAANNPSQDENDSTRTYDALLPLRSIANAGAAIVIAHHLTKKDSHGRQSARGSTAFVSFVDTIIELFCTNPQVRSDRRRTLKAIGRYDDTPAELVIELTDSGYQCIGSKADATQQDRQEVIKEILAGKGWSTDDAIRSLWIDKEIPVPGKRSLQKDLNAGCESGLWQRQGKGTKGDKYRYKFDSRTLPPPGASSESNATEG